MNKLKLLLVAITLNLPVISHAQIKACNGFLDKIHPLNSSYSDRVAFYFIPNNSKIIYEKSTKYLLTDQFGLGEIENAYFTKGSKYLYLLVRTEKHTVGIALKSNKLQKAGISKKDGVVKKDNLILYVPRGSYIIDHIAEM